MITLVAAALVSSAALAQDKKEGQRPEKKFDKTEMVKHRTDETVKRYSLNSKQAAQLLELNTKYADKMGPRRGGPHGHHGHHGAGRPPKDGGKDMKGQRPEPPKDGKRPELTEEQKQKMDARRKEMDATMKAYDTELQKILTPDQYKSYKADMEKHRPTRGDKARP